MRDYVVLAIIFLSVPVSLIRPFVGVLVWTWIAFMNPHRLSWGVAQTFPVAWVVGAATLAGFALSNEPKRLVRSMGTYSLLILWGWTTLSTLGAHLPDYAFADWDQRSKIFLMVLVLVSLTTTRERLRMVALVTAASIGFFGLKGGVFAIMTGGAYRAYGPNDTFLGDNNALALALNMTVPMLYYLRKEFPLRVARLVLLGVAFAAVIAVACTYSRGGLLGMAVVGGLLALKSRHKLTAITVVVAATAAVVYMMPGKWSQRMHTIETYQADQSAMSRLDAWRLAWRLGLARPVLGWGPQAMEDKNLYDRYFPDSPTRNDVHSSYFQILSELGFPGLAVFVFLLVWSVVKLQRLGQRFRGSGQHEWVATYADMFQVSIVAYAVSGAFLELAAFDLYYQIIGFTIVLEELARSSAVPVALREGLLERARRPPTKSFETRPIGASAAAAGHCGTLMSVKGIYTIAKREGPRAPSGTSAASGRAPSMRVLVISSVYPAGTRPTFGVFVHERVRHVASHCAVTVVSPVPWIPLNRWIRGREHAAVPLAEVLDGITVYHPRFLSFPRFGKALDALLYFLSVLPLVVRLRRSFCFDLIDAHFAYPDGVAAVLLAKVFGCPVTITLRGDEARVMKFRLRRFQIGFALRRARVVAVSDSLRQLAGDLGISPGAVQVIPNGVDDSCFRPLDRRQARRQLGLPLDRTILLGVGALIERKGHHRVLELLPEIAAQRPDVLYLAVGGAVPGNAHPRLLEKLIVEKGLEHYARIVPPQAHAEIPLWMAAADVFCLATRWEGWCNALMEALACGLPVVTTRVGGNAEFIRDGQDGLLVPYWNPQAFAAAVLKALVTNWDRRAIAARARTRSWRQVAERVVEEFIAALAHHPEPVAVEVNAVR